MMENMENSQAFQYFKFERNMADEATHETTRVNGRVKEEQNQRMNKGLILHSNMEHSMPCNGGGVLDPVYDRLPVSMPKI